MEEIAGKMMTTPATLRIAVVVASVQTAKVSCLMASTVTKTVIASVTPTVAVAALSADLAHPGDARQRSRLEDIAKMTMTTHVLLENVAVAASVPTRVVGCLRITTVTRTATARMVCIVTGVALTQDLVEVEPVRKESMMGTGTGGKTFHAGLTRETVTIAEGAAFLSMENVLRIQTANTTIVHVTVFYVPNGIAVGIANIRENTLVF